MPSSTRSWISSSGSVTARPGRVGLAGHQARQAYLRIAGFLERLRKSTEQLDGCNAVPHPQRSAPSFPAWPATAAAASPQPGLNPYLRLYADAANTLQGTPTAGFRFIYQGSESVGQSFSRNGFAGEPPGPAACASSGKFCDTMVR
jgi:hypothetical protein